MGCVAQLLPSVNVERENTDPRAVVRLTPNTLVDEFAIVTMNSVEIVLRAVRLDSLHEQSVLRL